MKKYIVDTKYGQYVIEAPDEKTAAKQGYKNSMKDAVSVEQFRRVSELLKSIRLDITSEFETINQYEAHAAMAIDLGYEKIGKLLNDIRNEERVHVGELVAALSEIDRKDGESFNSGVDEASKLINGANEPASLEETSAIDEAVQSVNIDDIIKQIDAYQVATGTFNGQPVYFLSFSSPEALESARETLNNNNIEIVQSTESPVAKLYMLTIKQTGEEYNG